jgi:uncharacterized protein (TIGR03435 family)
MIRRSFLAVWFAAGMAAAQAPAPAAFEVATIKPSAPLDRAKLLTGQAHLGMKVDGARVDIGYFSLSDLIRAAYAIKPYQLQGPGWMNDQRWDVQAKLPEGAAKEQVPQMLQALLAERFRLEVRRASTEHSVYALVVGKNGAKLKEAEAEPPATAADAPAGRGEMVLGEGENQVRISPAPGGGRGATVSSAKFGQMKILPGEEGTLIMQFSRMGMADLADMLSPFVEKPVVNDTGLKERYQVELELKMPDLMKMAAGLGMAGMMDAAHGGRGQGQNPAADASDPSTSIFSAVEKLGLKLDSRKAPLETITVERLEKTPTEN